MRRAGYIVELKSNPDLQSKKAGPNALPFVFRKRQEPLDEMNSHAAVGAAIGLIFGDNSNAFGRIRFLEKLVFPEDFA